LFQSVLPAGFSRLGDADGLTCQPAEHVEARRLIPGLDVPHPADASETAASWDRMEAGWSAP
jgi:transketolase